MGLDVYLHDGSQGIEAKSERHPDHLFEKGYLRSSYNDGGIDRVMGNLISTTLSQIFDAPPDRYDFGFGKRRQAAALERLREALEKMRSVQANGSGLSVSTESPMLLGQGPDRIDSEDAIRIVREAQEEHAKRAKDPKAFQMSAYSNRAGTFFLDEPLEVVALVRGYSVLGEPAFHVVTKMDLKWYIEALEVTEEFIEHAGTLAQPRLHWSS